RFLTSYEELSRFTSAFTDALRDMSGEMTRWGQAPEGQVSDAEAVYRPDLYDAAMGASAAPEVSDPLGLFTG
ncbi:hypothetical protein ACIKTA_19180, partial [Hansschlegelia beijingensis]